MSVPARLRRRVIARAMNVCEYCGLSQVRQEATFHIDHVVPKKAGGPTTAANLALACVSCSLRKAARESAADPETLLDVPLFHPRRQNWHDHFRWNGFEVVGITPSGRATIAALQLNRPALLAIRAEEAVRGRHPHPDS